MQYVQSNLVILGIKHEPRRQYAPRKSLPSFCLSQCMLKFYATDFDASFLIE